MLPEHQVRLPLQSGTTAVWSLARIAVALFPGLLLLDGSLNLLFARGEPSWTQRALQAPWLLEGIDPTWIMILNQSSMLRHIFLGTALTAGVALLGFCWLHLRQLWRTRPSDMVISPWGVQIQRWGRPISHHWEDIAGPRLGSLALSWVVRRRDSSTVRWPFFSSLLITLTNRSRARSSPFFTR